MTASFGADDFASRSGMRDDYDVADSLSSVSHALGILRLLERSGPLGVTAIAKELGVSSSTAHRLVSTLAAEEFVQQVSPSRKYALRSSVTLTSPSELLARCIEVARPRMMHLRSRTTETIHLAVMVGPSIRYVSVVESEHMMKVSSRVGSESPAHLTAAGKILLSRYSNQDIERLYDGRVLNTPTESSIATVGDLLDEVARVREAGFARNRSESEVGMYALAVPVLDNRGRVVCAITIAAPDARVRASDGSQLSEVELEMLRLLQAASADISGFLARSPSSNVP